MSDAPPLGLFEAVGVEIEYMIVDRRTLDIRPICDRLLTAEAGELTGDISFDDVTWCNELALHIVEMKTSDPATNIPSLAGAFHDHAQRINRRLASLDARLMPGAMHPWMDASADVQLWPHEYTDVYRAFDRLFNCRGHGWVNIQSMHINLPWADADQFGRLHAAIRLVLPLLPALAAASPCFDGKLGPWLCNRIRAYRDNSRRIPEITGQVVPEPVFSPENYQRHILQPIYDALKPHDPQGVLQYEWANARGAIARFNRNTIEIRVIDVQECPAADLAIVALTVAVLKRMVGEHWSAYEDQCAMPTEALAALLMRAAELGPDAIIDNPALLRLWGWTGPPRCTLGELWRHLHAQVVADDPHELDHCDLELRTLFDQGPLATRMRRTLGQAPDSATLHAVYSRLCDCIETNRMFQP